MILIFSGILVFILAILLINKFNLGWGRAILLVFLPSILFGLYSTIENAEGSILFSLLFPLVVSYYIFFPALVVFSVSMLMIEKKFQLNLFCLTLISIAISGLCITPYLFIERQIIITNGLLAPLAFLIEGLYYRWKIKKLSN